MFILILLLAIALGYGLVLVYVAYHRGRVAYSAKATRAEKNLRHVATLVTVVLTTFFLLGLHHWEVTSDGALMVLAAFMTVVLMLRSILVELGLRRVNPSDV
ncbi:hypothetical protein Pan97_50300 [Bremerella volcania]|uniref:Uncharacterized protein n=2 Tax=Bremerella volcania TaxID=2527984 RepID=A0A518CFF9_9BACT|nr:hypothetical protein Pan97_50300 [Bremerella volcania]